LSGGQVLVLSSSGAELQLHRPNSAGGTRSWALPEVRRNASMVTVPDGRVLISGGHDARGTLQRDGVWFDPELLTVEPAVRLPVTPRSGHTATVLTDGRVLFAGGTGAQGPYELWNPQSNAWSQVDGAGVGAGHHAVLRADGQVRLFNGSGAAGASRTDLLFDPSVNAVVARSAASDAPASTDVLAGSLPEQGSANTPVDATLSLRFSDLVRLDELNSASVSLFGPGGVTPIRVTAAESGRLAFVHPARQLFPDAPYTLMVKGVSTQKGKQLPLITLDFRTAALASAPSQPQTDGTQAAATSYCEGRSRTLQPCQRQGEMQEGIWTPGQDNAGENWRVPGRQPEPTYLGLMPDIFKAWGKTALTGTVLRADGAPVAGVAVSIGSTISHTNSAGQFLLYDVPKGRQRVYVDGTTANAPGLEYGQFVVGVDVQAGGLTQVPFTMWLPRIAERDKIKISSPTTREQVLTHPDLPGMELRIPAGTVIRDQKGKIVTEVAIVPTPVNRSPYPLPTNFPMYFTLQPGGAVLQGLTPEAGRGARVYYPNYDRHPEGTRADFWLYDAMEGWRVYGQGRVNREETQFVPEAGVALHEVVTFGAAVSPDDPAPEEGMPPDPQECGECNAGTGSNATAGDPIDLRTGRYTYSETDIAITDVLPITLGRNYRPTDYVKREFGIGTAAGFMYRLSQRNNYAQMQLVLPNGVPITFSKKSGSGAYGEWSYSGKHELSGAIIASESTGGWKYRLSMRDGSQMTFEQYSPNRIKTFQDRYGNMIEYQYDAGRVSRILSPNGRYINLNYDTQNRITSAVDPLGTTWRYEYNAQGMLEKVIYPDTTNRRYEYKGYGPALNKHYYLTALHDQRGNRVLLNQYEEINMPDGNAVTTGRVVKQVLADGAVYEMQYDHIDGLSIGTLVAQPDGSRRRVTFAGGMYPVTDTLAYGTSLAQTYTFERDDGGRLTAKTDPMGRRTEYQFNALGEAVRVATLVGTPLEAVMTATYTAAGEVATITDELGRISRYTYEQGCLAQVIDPQGNVRHLTCNDEGRHDTLTDPLSNTSMLRYAGPDLVAFVDAMGRSISFRHDALGRAVASELPDGRVLRVEYDMRGRLTKTVDPDGAITEFAYDGNGNLTDVLLPHQAGVTYEYDERDRLVRRVDGLGQAESWSYDKMSRLLSYSDRRQFTTRYTYDALGRRMTSKYHDGSAVTATYDSGNRMISLEDSVSGLTTWTYDAGNRPLAMVTPQGPVQYGYDKAGRRTSMAADAQPVVEYEYDDLDQLVRLSQGTEVVDFSYDAAGRRKVVRLPNRVETAYSYNPDNAVAAITWGMPGGTPLGALAYGFDGSGQLVSQSGQSAPRALPQATEGDAIYDDNHRLISVGGQSLQYDANGNLLDDGVRSYEWDARNQLTRIREGGVVVAEFGYDVMGRRIRKAESGRVVEYLYDGSNVVLERSNSVVTSILSGLDVDQRFARDVEGGRAYFSVDHLGSTRALTNGLGEELVAYDYDPYGGSVASSSQIENAYQFTGRERDDTGFYYYRARYYDPAMGRFISEDPIGMAAGLNTYAYVNGKPLSFTDPSGLFEVYAYGTRGGGVGNEWQYVIEFNPLSPKDIPMWGGKARKFFDRVGTAVNMTKPSSAGPRDSAGYVECGTLDAKLKKAYRDAGYRDEQRMSRQQAMDFLSEAYRGNADMRRMYDSPKAMLDSATEKGRSNWYNSLIEQAHPGEF